MSKQIFIDTETTGLNPEKDTITQIAAIYKNNGKVVKRVNIKKNIAFEFDAFLKSIVNPYDKDDKAYMLAWNAKFDSEFLHSLFKNIKTNYGNYFYHMPVDIQQICADKFMRKNIVPENFKLETIARYYKIPCNASNFHDAAYDIDITNKIYLKLRK